MVRAILLALVLLLPSSRSNGAPLAVFLDFEAFGIGEVFPGTSLSPALPDNPGMENYVMFSSSGFGSFVPSHSAAALVITSGAPFGTSRSICPRSSTGLGDPVNCAGALNLLFASPGAMKISFDVAADDVTEEIGVIAVLGPTFSDLVYGVFALDGRPLTSETVSLSSLSFNENPDGSGLPVVVTDSTPLLGFVVHSAVDPAGLLYDNIQFTLPMANVPEPSVLALLGSALAGIGLARRKLH